MSANNVIPFPGPEFEPRRLSPRAAGREQGLSQGKVNFAAIDAKTRSASNHHWPGSSIMAEMWAAMEVGS